MERWGAGDLSARVPVEGSDEVAFLAERFNHAAERIERLLASHKSLLANASHELRSPLARIRMGLELMEGGDGAKPPRFAAASRSWTSWSTKSCWPVGSMPGKPTWAPWKQWTWWACALKSAPVWAPGWK